MSEYLTPKKIKSRIKLGKAIFVDGELEVKCCSCDEFLPHDEEFFYKAGKYGLSSRCKACDQENKARESNYVKAIYQCKAKRDSKENKCDKMCGNGSCV